VNGTWQNKDDEEFNMFATRADTGQQEYTVNNVVNQAAKLKLTEILLDNQADISIVHPRLLPNVRQAERMIKVRGVGGLQLIVNRVGTLEGFFQVYASEHTKANVLSFSEVEDKYRVTYEAQKAFVVHMPNREPTFSRRQKLYIADWESVAIVAATVQENEQLHTKEEVRHARLAYEFIRNAGYPSVGEAIHLLTDGNVRNLPKILPVDVERAYRIYGIHPEYVKGQLVKQTVARMPVDTTLRHTDKNLKLSTDVMHVDGQLFLVSVADPLNLMLQSKIESESRTTLGLALQGHLAVLRSRDFNPRVVYVDPHSSFRVMTQDFPGVEIDVGGAGDYIAKVDAKIRRIKETY
jgi:hypothetical protein